MILNYEKTIEVHGEDVILQEGMYFKPSNEYTGYLVQKIARGDYGIYIIANCTASPQLHLTISKYSSGQTLSLSDFQREIEHFCTGEISYDFVGKIKDYRSHE